MHAHFSSPSTGINHANARPLFVAINAQLHSATRFRILARVVQKVSDDLLNSVGVGPGHRFVFGFLFHFDVFFAKGCIEIPNDTVDQSCDPHAGRLQFRFAPFRFRQLQQIGDQSP